MASSFVCVGLGPATDPGSSVQQIVLDCVALPINTTVLRKRLDGCENGGRTISFGITPKS